MIITRPITPDDAIAIALNRLKIEPQFSQPPGASLDGVIYCNSGKVVFDLGKELADAALFAAAFDSELRGMKDEMVDALSDSAFTKPAEVLGFQFRAHLCDENGEWNVDFLNNTFNPAFGVALSARLYARTP